MRIGAHVGVGRGWIEAVQYCSEVGAECLQVFTKSPRTWRAGPLPADALGPFAKEMIERDVAPAFVHTSYLINLGSDDTRLRERSVDALAEELRRAAAIGAAGLVTHVGTDVFADRERACEWIADAIAAAHEAASDIGAGVALLLENSAGTGRQYGSTAGELGRLLCAVEERRAMPIGICWDTCHAFAAGYSLSSPESWDDALDEIEDACGAGAVRLVHANDCLFARGERRDRHAWIGEGQMGEESFRSMFAVPRLAVAPALVEMPGEVPDKDALNVSRLRKLRDQMRR